MRPTRRRRGAALAAACALLVGCGCGSRSADEHTPGPWETHYRAGLEAMDQGRYATADSALSRAQGAAKAFTADDARLHRTIEALARVSEVRGQLARADTLFQQLLHIQQEHLGEDGDASVATFVKLAQLQRARGDLAGADSSYARLLSIGEERLRQGDLGITTTLGHAADLSRELGDFARADSLEKRQFGLQLYAQGFDHAIAGRLDQAEQYYRRALATQERLQGFRHPDLYRTCRDLARLYEGRGAWVQAEKLYRRGLNLQEGLHGDDHPALNEPLDDLAGLLEQRGRQDEARALVLRADALRRAISASQLR
jgi:tetratricopeptide (TPR) repeat protein